MGALIPVLVMLGLLQLGLDRPVAPMPGWLVACWCLVPLPALGVLHALRRGRRGHDQAVMVMVLIWFAWLCLGPAAWAARSGALTWGAAPWIAAMLVHLAGSGHGGLRDRAAGAWQAARIELAPILLVLPVIDICDALAGPLGTLAWFHGPYGFWFQLGGSFLLLAGVAMFLPWFLVRIWGARDLEPGRERAVIEDACRRAGIMPSRLLRWPSAHGPFINAAVIGVLPRLRYVLVTDDLLKGFPPRELVAVIGHELGHIRHRHLLVYILFGMLAMAAAAGIQVLLLGTPGSGWTGVIAMPPGADPVWLRAAVWVAAIVLLWRVVFGVLSRACEREADFHGARLAADPGAMQDALRRVAALSGTPEDAPGWRHGSIRERVAALDAAERDPTLADLHHRKVGVIKQLLFFSLALAAGLAVAVWTAPAMPPDRTAATRHLAAMVVADPDLGAALRTADDGDLGPLLRWLGRADADRRRELLATTLAQWDPADDAGGHPLRHRLAAFAATRQGDPAIDLVVDNALAYALMVGPQPPAAGDLAQAKSIAPRLAEAQQRSPEHGIADTLGCIAWHDGRRDEALRLFRQAAELHASQDPKDARSAELYRQRIAAAESGAADLPRLLPDASPVSPR